VLLWLVLFLLSACFGVGVWFSCLLFVFDCCGLVTGLVAFELLVICLVLFACWFALFGF